VEERLVHKVDRMKIVNLAERPRESNVVITASRRRRHAELIRNLLVLINVQYKQFRQTPAGVRMRMRMVAAENSDTSSDEDSGYSEPEEDSMSIPPASPRDIEMAVA